MEPYLIVTLLAFSFGFFSDFADLFDEHGLRWFKYADIFFGIVWGAAGAVMLYLYPWAGTYMLGMMLYWLVKNKLDYFNHQLATAMILLVAFQVSFEQRLPVLPTLLGFLFQILFVYVAYQPIKKYFQGKKIPKVFDIRHLLPPLLVAVIFGQALTVFAFVVAFTGVHISDWWYRRIRQGISPVGKVLGIAYHIEYDLEK